MRKCSIDLRNLKKEVRIDYFKSSGPGGQHKNKTMSCVRLLHKPTGIKVIATESRSQIRNRELAFKRLQVKLMELNIREKERIPTKKPYYAKEKILRDKRKGSQKKQLRKKVSENEIEFY
ncbi:MAG: peptide chain release factor-like protein [Candidatus Scalinduaceae bacterium]